MVLTGAVAISDAGPTRRGLLAAAVGVTTLGGCGIFDARSDRPAAPDPERPVLDEAVALATAYDRAAAVRPGLTRRLAPLAADHRAHIAELSRVMGTPAASASASAPAATPGGDAVATLEGLRAAEQTAQRSAYAACRQAPAARAALLGSIAACRASHAEALR
jgi:hypothetical protein